MPINSLEDNDNNTSSCILLVLFIFSNRIFMAIERVVMLQKVESVT